MTIQDILRALLASNLSQAEISRRSGIPQPSIHRLLNDKQDEVVYSHGKSLERLLAQVRPDINLCAFDEAAHDERGPRDNEMQQEAA